MTDHTRYDLPTRPEPQAASAAPASVCPDCGGRGWRRQMGATACACLVRDVRAQAADHHGLVDRLTVRLAEIEERTSSAARPDRLDQAMSWAAALAAVCLLVSVCDPTPARAEDCDRYAAVAQGAPAPCDGIVTSPGELARFLLVEDERDKLRVDLAAEREQHVITRAEGAELLRLCEASRRVCEERQAPPVVARAWWDSPWVGAVVGVVVGVGVTVGVVIAAR